MRPFILLLLLTVTAAAQQPQQSYNLTTVDPKNTRDYPGGRGEHQLIIYTEAYGRPSTGTNQWGAEATVKDDIVIKFGGNNSVIRPGEYVISGHGRARVFLQNTVKVGAKIVRTDSTVTVVFDRESFRIYSDLRRAELVRKYERIKQQLNDSERVMLRSVIDSLSIVRDTPGDSSVTSVDSSLYDEGMRLLDEIEYRISVSPSVEGRGVWHRPVEKNNEEIAATVARLADAGFNMIFLETIWRGETIYPGFITQQKKEFVGFDPLRSFIDEGKKRGVEVHAWIHTFFVGYLGPDEDTSSGPILLRHPEWQLVKRNGGKVSTAEPGYLYVNPAHPEAQDFIASLYREVHSNYPDIAGIQMDYIRYPVNVPLEESSDYSELSRSRFKAQYGVDPLQIDPTTDPAVWELWRLWREQVITGFVKRIRWENPEVLLSADIFPDIDEAERTKMQKWSTWAAMGYVNFLAPMVYTVNAEWIAESIGRMRGVIGDSFPLHIGLAPYLKLSPAQLLQQIEICRDLRASGVILFSSADLSPEQLRLLRIGPFRTAAQPPTLITKRSKP
ncbi:MAG: family 10 glycosylhydrolase [Bacteroidetes bacterium]|nr:family 10 glycosylhydrolase [Bacteroidota bacterium]